MSEPTTCKRPRPQTLPRSRGLGWLSAALLLLLLAGLAVPAANSPGLADQHHEIGLERDGFRAIVAGADQAGDAATAFWSTAGGDRPHVAWRGLTPSGSPPARAPTA